MNLKLRVRVPGWPEETCPKKLKEKNDRKPGTRQAQLTYLAKD